MEDNYNTNYSFGKYKMRQGIGKLYAGYMLAICWLYVSYMSGICKMYVG
jgi:hypothetical protein